MNKAKRLLRKVREEVIKTDMGTDLSDNPIKLILQQVIKLMGKKEFDKFDDDKFKKELLQGLQQRIRAKRKKDDWIYTLSIDVDPEEGPIGTAGMLRAIDGETFRLIGDRSKEKNKLSDMKLF